MKKKITFTASYILEVEDEYIDEDICYYDSFEEIEDCDYDNVGRPLEHLRDLGWEITKTEVETV